MDWWLWILLGIVFLLLELITPGGFWIVFFGFGALVVGVLALSGLVLLATAQWLLFSLVSVASIALARKPLLHRFRSMPASDVDRIVGETAVALSNMDANQIGKAELRGSAWNARNIGSHAVSQGERCRVEHIEGFMLLIRRSEEGREW